MVQARMAAPCLCDVWPREGLRIRARTWLHLLRQAAGALVSILDGFVPESARAMTDDAPWSEESIAARRRRDVKERVHSALATIPRPDRHTVILDVMADFILEAPK